MSYILCMQKCYQHNKVFVIKEFSLPAFPCPRGPNEYNLALLYDKDRLSTYAECISEFIDIGCL
jgi:hypothetical protein